MWTALALHGVSPSIQLFRASLCHHHRRLTVLLLSPTIVVVSLLANLRRNRRRQLARQLAAQSSPSACSPTCGAIVVVSLLTNLRRNHRRQLAHQFAAQSSSPTTGLFSLSQEWLASPVMSRLRKFRPPNYCLLHTCWHKWLAGPYGQSLMLRGGWGSVPVSLGDVGDALGAIEEFRGRPGTFWQSALDTRKSHKC